MAASWTRAVGPGEVAGVNAVGRQGDVVGNHHVGRRESQHRAAPPVPVHHGAPHLVGPPQQLGRADDVALRPPASGSGSMRRTALRMLGRLRSGGRRSPEAVLPAQLGQQGDVALPPVTEMEVLAHHDEAGPQSVDQHLLDEILGGLVGPRPGRTR